LNKKIRNEETGVWTQEIHAPIDSQAASHLAAIARRISRDKIIKKPLRLLERAFQLAWRQVFIKPVTARSFYVFLRLIQSHT